NLEALEAAGAEILWFSPLADGGLPAGTQGVYLGGGFPEVHARALAENRGIRHDLREAARSGLPVYAECGGLMALARELVDGKERFPMSGALDLVVEQTPRPQGHGYVIAGVAGESRWFGRGSTIRGHEFHYSRVVTGGDVARAVLELERGTGLGNGRDGIVKGTVWASYLHVHAASVPGWAERFGCLCTGGSGCRVEPAAAEV
ncbi:MAG TPA: cobyrinic acid a,c-diamide synthase, partial [Acidobacteria bacterium]|nr:cobyrinic acid a,c-diamide synthase [Acidobacteriota bacterium]